MPSILQKHKRLPSEALGTPFSFVASLWFQIGREADIKLPAVMISTA